MFRDQETYQDLMLLSNIINLINHARILTFEEKEKILRTIDEVYERIDNETKIKAIEEQPQKR